MQTTQQMPFPPSVAAQALPSAWLSYRDAYAVIQHLRVLYDAGQAWVSPNRIREDLALIDAQLNCVVDYLSETGFVRRTPTGTLLALTRRALAYLDGGRGRRFSVRPA